MFDDARHVIATAIADRQIPGAVWAAVHGGRVIGREAQGFADPEQGRPMHLETLFDLASLTKVVATLPVILRMLEQGTLRLDDPLQLFLPRFPSPEVRIRHLLTHTAGFPSGEPLHGRGFSRAEAMAHLEQLTPSLPIGGPILYSDISFQLLGLLIERLTGSRLDQVARRTVFEPLRMERATFSPGAEAAPTEYREYLGRRQQGEVHDENATVLEGVAGHAGLFGTLDDLIRYAAAWMGWPGHRLLSPAAREAATRVQAQWEGERRGLGWLLRSPQYPSCGDLFGERSFGHTGFTGTSLWCDPERDLAVILLTNRVYYGRRDPIIRLRPRFHNALLAALN